MQFLLEPRASMALGNTCATCSTHADPDGFVNTNIDVLGRGRLYLCAGCVRQMAVGVGCLEPAQVHVLRGQLEEVSAAAEELMAEVERERLNKVVPLAEIVDYFSERERLRPNEPKPVTQPKKAS